MAGLVVSWPHVRPGEVYACEPKTPCRLPDLELLLVMVCIGDLVTQQKSVLVCPVVCCLVRPCVLRLRALRQAFLLFRFFLFPSPPHSALGCDDVGDRILFCGAGASVAQPCLLVPSASACSSDASVGSLHSAGLCTLPSRSVAPISRSVKFNQSKSGNVSAQTGQRIAAASVGNPGATSTQSSSKVILNRQVFVSDLGFVSSCVAIRSDSVVGSVSGRQPQQLPSSLHCVLRLRGGGRGAMSSSSSSDDGLLGSFDMSRSFDMGNEAAGSGFGDGRRTLNDGRGYTTRRASAGVPAKEEGRRNQILDHVVNQETLFRNIGLGRDQEFGSQSFLPSPVFPVSASSAFWFGSTSCCSDVE